MVAPDLENTRCNLGMKISPEVGSYYKGGTGVMNKKGGMHGGLDELMRMHVKGMVMMTTPNNPSHELGSWCRSRWHRDGSSSVECPVLTYHIHFQPRHQALHEVQGIRHLLGRKGHHLLLSAGVRGTASE